MARNKYVVWSRLVQIMYIVLIAISMANRKLVAMNCICRNRFSSIVLSTAFDRPVDTSLSIDWIQPKTSFDWNHLLNRLFVCVECCSRTKKLNSTARLDWIFPNAWLVLDIHAQCTGPLRSKQCGAYQQSSRTPWMLFTHISCCSFTVFLSIHCVDVFEWAKNSTLLFQSVGVPTACEQQLYIQYYLCWDCLFRTAEK